MQKPGKTFSESWHRVANLKVGLRPTVRVKRQFFRGEKWYVLHDPFNNQYFRLRPEAHEFVVRLRSERTVEEVSNILASGDRKLASATAPAQGLYMLAVLYDEPVFAGRARGPNGVPGAFQF